MLNQRFDQVVLIKNIPDKKAEHHLLEEVRGLNTTKIEEWEMVC